MWAMILKEFRQLRRDRRMLAMLIVLPVLLLVVFGYAANYVIRSVPTVVVGPQAAAVAASLPPLFDVVAVRPHQSAADARAALRDGRAIAAIVTGGGAPTVLLDGTQLFATQAAQAALAQQEAGQRASAQGSLPQAPALPAPQVHVLFNPTLRTSTVMVPGLAGIILVFVGTVVTSVGVVRERQAGTLEQLAVMPLRPTDIFLGKIAPYFLVASADLLIVIATGVAVFHVPFRGSPIDLALGALLFLFVTLGMGVLISTVSENQGQAIQLAILAVLPEVLLSGLIFPLSSIAVGVRWIAYILPLTYFNQIARGVMLRGASITALWRPFLYLGLLGAVTGALAVLRFRRFLAPAAPASPAGPRRGARHGARHDTPAGTP